MRGVFFPEGGPYSYNSYGRSYMDPHTRKTYLQRCKFSAVTTGTVEIFLLTCELNTEHWLPVDDAKPGRIKEDAKVVDGLGLIEVKIYRATSRGCSNRPTRSRAIESKDLEVSEKSLKGRALSHGASYVFQAVVTLNAKVLKSQMGFQTRDPAASPHTCRYAPRRRRTTNCRVLLPLQVQR